MPTRSISATLYLSLCVLTIVDALFTVEIAVWIAIAFMAAFILIEFRRAARLQQAVSLALAGIGILAGGLEGEALETLLGGLRRTLPFLLLFGSVTWLQGPASRSPSLLTVREIAIRQPSGRRFAVIALAAHFLGVAFNLAGLSLLTPMVGGDTPKPLRERLGRAMVQGFAAGTAWSPFYVGTAVILSAVPGVRWLEVAPLGIALSLSIVGCSWVFDRIFLRAAAQREMNEEPKERGPAPPFTRRHAISIALLLGTLFGITILLVEGLRLSIPVSLAIVAPPFALAWAIALAGKHLPSAAPDVAELKTTDRGGSALFGQVFAKIPDLRGETMLFAGANILGVGIASALDPDVVAQWVTNVTPNPIVTIPALMAAMMFTSIIGLHPVVFVVLVTSILPPEALGVAPPIAAMAMMCLWGQGTNASPFSATVLFISRITGDSNWRIAWRWNAPFSLSVTLLLAAILVLVQLSGIYG
ncbi:hypothetical protein EOI86_21375 [Hwanghaeella grinnelliae]|uniref:Citrate transporter n=1 Tax=Hwanghaeella grinnelliae TaxID=2500179 RepID=A0A3S2WP03_9PROT|nr:hypothetical protein [Hwanghaeella grinnelliae]RVU33704.1 hypothetical protein EOI86_21375 [Hwanghaeella grinnelliae]